MQPYIFPYLGYFQLIAAVDKFVVYDDIDFIKQGWINRNNILLNGTKYLFTIPVQSISSNTLIHQTLVSDKPLKWDHKLVQTFTQAYKKAPYFKEIFPIIENVFTHSSGKSIGMLATVSITSVLQYLSIQTDIVQSEGRYNNQHLKNADRVIDICKIENAHTYINAIGGIELYDRLHFAQNEIALKFLQSVTEKYQQFGNEFINGLSIIDVLMFNHPDTIKNDILPNYSLI